MHLYCLGCKFYWVIFGVLIYQVLGTSLSRRICTYLLDFMAAESKSILQDFGSSELVYSLRRHDNQVAMLGFKKIPLTDPE